jgi:hypothetical protein
MTTRIRPLLLVFPCALAALACELPTKDLGDPTAETTAETDVGGTVDATTGFQMAAPDTLDPQTTSTTGDPGDGTALAAPDTLDPQTTGGTTGGGDEVQCAADPPVFPAPPKACAVDEDCAVVFHQVDCCGSRAGLGIDADAVDEFMAAEEICAAQYPGCDCAAQPTTAEDGQSTADESQIQAHCVDELCASFIPGDPCEGVDLPACPPACDPETFPGGCGEPCEPEGAACGNNIGDGMQCVGGAWACTVHPPLGEGCNLICK